MDSHAERGDQEHDAWLSRVGMDSHAARGNQDNSAQRRLKHAIFSDVEPVFDVQLLNPGKFACIGGDQSQPQR